MSERPKLHERLVNSLPLSPVVAVRALLILALGASGCHGMNDSPDTVNNDNVDDTIDIWGDNIDGDDDSVGDDDDTVPEEFDFDEDGVPNDDDCAPYDPLSYPGAEEICDGIANDCTESLDSSEIDSDGDGVMPCEGDCDDLDPNTYPEALEICDGISTSCESLDPSEIDSDGDGIAPCEGDCDDSDNTVRPWGVEVCGDGADQDCDGVDLECPTVSGLTLSCDVTTNGIPTAGECIEGLTYPLSFSSDHASRYEITRSLIGGTIVNPGQSIPESGELSTSNHQTTTTYNLGTGAVGVTERLYVTVWNANGDVDITMTDVGYN